MKKILLHFKRRLIAVAIMLTVVQLMVIYLFNFQNKAPFILWITNIYGCFTIFVISALPFLVARRAARDGLLGKDLAGWKLGLIVNLLFIGISLLFSFLDAGVKLAFFGSPFAGQNVAVSVTGTVVGALVALVIGPFAGWIAQRMYRPTAGPEN